MRWDAPGDDIDKLVLHAVSCVRSIFDDAGVTHSDVGPPRERLATTPGIRRHWERTCRRC